MEEQDGARLVQTAMERACGSWPGVAARLAEFESHARNHAVPASDLANRGHEFYLAFACSRGDEVAIRILENEYLARAIRVMARVNSAREFVDDASQTLRERLLVGPEPRIAQFAASGPLGAWLRVAALRTALNLLKVRRNPDELLSAEMLELPAPMAVDGEHHQEIVQAAVEVAFKMLSARERNVLRLSYIEGSSIDHIAALYGSHRATAARWISAARERVLDHVAESVRVQLGLSASDARSLLLRVRSRIRISVMRLLDEDLEQETAPAPH